MPELTAGQKETVDLLRAQRARGLAIVFISHDLALVATLADRIVVMYAGRVVESAPARTLYSHPRHPYTQALLRSVPSLRTDRSQPLVEIAGQPVSASTRASGCAFEPRCAVRERRCRNETPELRSAAGEHFVACHVAAPAASS